MLSGQGTNLAPITLSSYGIGDKPLIRSSASTVVGGTNIGGWTINGLKIECTSIDPINVGVQNTGIQFTYDGSGVYSNINIINNEISGTSDLKYDRNTQGVRIITLSNNDGQNQVLSNINISNNLIHNLGWLGIATTGWNIYANRDNHSTKLYADVCVNNNTIHSTGVQGITVHSVQDGTIFNNLVYDCGEYDGTNVLWGTSGIWCMLSSDIDITHNEVFGQSESGNTNYDSSGFDIDWTCENINLQYNYAHDNDGPGIETMSNKNCTIMYNKVSGNKGLSHIGNGQITLSSYTGNPDAMTGLNNLIVSSNLIIVDIANTVAVFTNSTWGGVWSNNKFTNNHIVMNDNLIDTKVYEISDSASFEIANNNTIYSSSGITFIGKINNSTYNNLIEWTSATGFDMDSDTTFIEFLPANLYNIN